ncbi:probable glucan 1,3-alpha-glucosidase isoform X2 [Ricinus communis]|uniref:Probable glucan 1,3-alpha-glucosidase n=1 Tax=Ricinus communis TaxID=3988 RepID=B9STU2_RICCO|nr:probable glucan 1,3-alpha-glucosidase isoform X2 [Ricinus communis]EEF33007.1 neutral alpha-glucosidase ab precursor, putative [Ricinus communis]|eukprot:XP_002529411.1 probable glucan 1,3-alpha-glucosidase [Ricinus communis]
MKGFLYLFVVFLIFLCFQTVFSWKKDEFRNCNQTPFCKRARSRKPGESSLIAHDVTISDGDVTAKLLPKQQSDQDQDHDQIKALSLTLSIYQDGIMRLKIDEADPQKKRRFQVPDVIVSEFEEKKLWLQRVSTETFHGGDASVVYLSDGYEVVLVHDPFEVFVREKNSKDARVVSLNSHQLFDFEQLRDKKEGDDWEERFRSHTDTRPYGPQSISFDVSFYGADFVSGIPEHATSLALKPTRGPGVEFSEPYRLFNLDVFEYLHESPFGLYGSIPFMIGHGKSGRSSGFFWLNAAEMQIDVLGDGWDAESGISLPSKQSRIDTFWMSEAGIVDAFFFVGPGGPKDVVNQYTSVTGKPSMPQLFSTAYHQCRWNYRDEEDVENVDSKFDEHDIPYDVLWLDIEHTDGKKYFTWDSVLFPHPEDMQRKLAAKGRHMVTIVDPHVKRDDSFFLHKQATEKGYYVKDANGNDYDGWCWPGSSSYLDMLNPEIRSWWGDKFSYNEYVGSTSSLYIWNDMNEPSVFNGPEVTMPRDALHYGGIEHRELHNSYGYYFHMATSDGLLKRGDGKNRPFVLSRAFFAGSQRYGAVWTGDNTAEWDHLRVSVPMILTLGISGMSFSGADVGGFFGNPEPELLVRWYQLGAYYPFFRAHAHQDTKRREPWLFGERNTELIREAIHVRYMLLPYFYTLFREANASGIPVMRPLWMEFPSDEATFNNDEAFMVGSSLLVQGIYTERAKHATVYLPGKESWYDFKTGTAFKGGKTHKLEVSEESVPAFQRAGTILPRKDRYRRSSTQMVNDPYTLVIALNSSQAAEGELYVDDGESFEFLQGAFIHRRFVFSKGKLTSINLAPSSNVKSRFSSKCVIERIILLGYSPGAKDALIEPANHKVEIAPGPLRLHGSAGGAAVVTIRKPMVHIADDWTIKIL